jgi:hypothetical protein
VDNSGLPIGILCCYAASCLGEEKVDLGAVCLCNGKEKDESTIEGVDAKHANVGKTAPDNGGKD